VNLGRIFSSATGAGAVVAALAGQPVVGWVLAAIALGRVLVVTVGVVVLLLLVERSERKTVVADLARGLIKIISNS